MAGRNNGGLALAAREWSGASGLSMTNDGSSKRMRDESPWRPVLRRTDQAVVASLVVLALAGMAAYWVVMGGPRGGLMEIDRAAPRVARFRVDVNKAEWPELAQLPEVGETLARRIVESREEAGAFGELNDLRRVRGIGPRTLEQIRPYLLPMPGREEVARDAEREPGT